MTKLKMITLCGIFVGTPANGLIATAAQGVGAERPAVQPAIGTDAARQDDPPPFTQRDDYVVENPDLIYVEVEKQKALPGRPIIGSRLVRPDGTISLSFYGELFVNGLTVPEIKVKIIRHLQKFLRDEPLGLVELHKNGLPVIDVATWQPKRIDPKDSKAVLVRVTQCNSKYFYVEGEVLSPGRFPLSGKQGILDAITLAGGLSARADRAQIVLYRQGLQGGAESFTVDVDRSKQTKPPATDYQLKSGDRVVVRARSGGEVTTGRIPSDRAPDALPIEGPEEDEIAIDGPALERLEKRIADVEQKLDSILEMLKRQPG